MTDILRIILLLLTVASCSRSESDSNVESSSNSSDTILANKPNMYADYVKSKTKELNLYSIESGVDSFELRFWFKPELMIAGQFFLIHKVNSEWECKEYRYYEKSNKSGSYSIDSFVVVFGGPKSGWNSFIKKIEDQKICDLPGQMDIQGFNPKVNDGFTFYVECATKSKYRFYTYNCPEYYEEEFEECKRFAKIVRIFHEEFGFFTPEYRCFPKGH